MSSQTSSSSPTNTKSNPTTDSIVTQLSSHIQQGWGLLAIHCPICTTALVRNKQKEVYCVKCKLFCKTEQEAKAANLTISDQSVPDHSKAAVTSSPASSMATSTSSSSPRSSSPHSYSLANYAGHTTASTTATSGLASLSSSPYFANLQQELVDYNAKESSASTSKGNKDDRPVTSPTSSSSSVAGSDVASIDSAALSTSMNRMNSISSKLGAKMLAGWTLMGIHCSEDNCSCPLVRNKQTGEMLCVACGQTYRQEEEDKEKKEATVNAPISPVSSASSKPSAPASDLNASPPAPLFARQLTDHILASTNSDSTIDGAASPATTSHTHSDSVDSNSSDYEHLDLSASDRSRIDAISSILGDKMLEGYTLLGVECPNPSCDCPLIRKKDGPMLCVNCGATVITQDEYDPNKHGELIENGTAATGVHTNASSKSSSATDTQAVGSSSSSSSSPYSLADLTATAAASAAAAAERSRRSDEVSSALGVKLLQGYTMLAAECPNPSCNCPLVQKKDGPKMCVSCGETVMKEKEDDKKNQGELKEGMKAKEEGGGKKEEQSHKRHNMSEIEEQVKRSRAESQQQQQPLSHSKYAPPTRPPPPSARPSFIHSDASFSRPRFDSLSSPYVGFGSLSSPTSPAPSHSSFLPSSAADALSPFQRNKADLEADEVDADTVPALGTKTGRIARHPPPAGGIRTGYRFSTTGNPKDSSPGPTRTPPSTPAFPNASSSSAAASTANLAFNPPVIPPPPLHSFGVAGSSALHSPLSAGFVNLSSSPSATGGVGAANNFHFTPNSSPVNVGAGLPLPVPVSNRAANASDANCSSVTLSHILRTGNDVSGEERIRDVLSLTRESLVLKLDACRQLLIQSNGIEQYMAIAQTITALANALQALKNV